MDEIIELLRNEKIAIDYLGYNETEMIIDRIVSNDQLMKKLKKVRRSFWDDVLERGILIHSDLTYITESGFNEDVSLGYIDIDNGKKHMPSLAYQIKRKL